MDKVLVFGHKSPDTDTITSAIAMANLKTKLGEKAEARRLGNINKETKYALDYFKVEEPELLEEVEENTDVILVDHNEFEQSVKGIEKANIKMVVDHHRINNFKTSEPLYYIAEPVGCTATIIYKLYKQNDVEVDRKIAGLLLSAIVSDTLLLRSPTTTEDDKKALKELERIAKVDIDIYGLDLLKAGTDLSSFSSEELINLDSKLFTVKNKKFAISQVNTVDIQDIMRNKADIEEKIKQEVNAKGLDFFGFCVTDILNGNSEMIALGDNAGVVEKAYNVKLEDNSAFLEGVVSRKKQIVPIITKNIEEL